MGKPGRAVCIVTPMLLAAASLICFLTVSLAQVSPGSHNTLLQRRLYFFKANTSSMLLTPQGLLGSLSDSLPDVLPDVLPDSVLGIDIPDALSSVAKSGHLKDFYAVGLFGYCEGETDTQTGMETVTHCSAWKMPFYFDPVAVWQLEDTGMQAILGEKFIHGLKIYRKMVEVMQGAFVTVLALSVLECVAGMFAVESRWYSAWAAAVSFIQAAIAIVAAVVATVTYVALTGIFESVLRPYNIEASLGRDLFCVLWVAVAFSVASGFFWLPSVCFCSGK